MQVADAYTLMLRICGVGIGLDALERMASARKYRDDGLFGWVVLRQKLAGAPAPVRRLADLLCAGAARLMAVLVVRLAAVALVALCPPGSPAFGAGLTALVATHLYIYLRAAGFGTIGADHMTLLVCGGAWWATVVAGTPVAALAGLWFVAAQVCVSYVIAGVSKLAAPKWRSGEALVCVLSTYTVGSPALHPVVQRRPRLARLLCWSVMLWEATFPVVLVAPRPLVLPLLAVGLLFHLSLAAIMGLNLFVFAFASTYAAIWAVR
jgi:hypothetical protein